jgi:8-oxo-dGTP diphosphatase
MAETRQLFFDTPAVEETGEFFRINLELAVFRVIRNSFEILTLPTGLSPFEGDLRLPSTMIGQEGFETTARSYLKQKLSVHSPLHLEQVSAHVAPGTNLTINILFLGIVGQTINPTQAQGEFKVKGSFLPISNMEITGIPLPPHDKHMILLARHYLAMSLQNRTLATLFCPETFTLGDLRRVYESVWDTKLDHANFRRKILKSSGFVEYVSKHPSVHNLGRPAHLYQRGRLSRIYPTLQMPDRIQRK